MRLLAVVLIGLAAADGCAHHREYAGEARSLLGQPLYPPKLDAARTEKVEADLVQAQREYDADPSSEDKTIWLGRRLAYTGAFRASIRAFTDGLRKHPDSAALLRHRGHRYITVREFDNAIADLSRAAKLVQGKPDQVEPDGVPNEKSTPIGSLQSNIWYHLGLAHYLKGEFAQALEVYRERMDVSVVNDDRLVSTTYWMYLTLQKLGRTDEARAALRPIRADLKIIENQTYHRLLLLYKGELKPSDILDTSGDGPIENGTAAYGLGCHLWFQGDKAGAVRLWERIVASDNWPAFGSIAAEAELARIRR